MKLGVTPWDFADLSARSLTDQARAAEQLGYDSFWLPENHFNQGAIPDPLMLLAGVAAGTDTIRLGTTSYLLPLRHPLQAAEQVAVLDQLSGGRVILGIGRGTAPAMLRAFSVEPSQKRRLFEECLARMRLAWSGEPVTLEDGETTIVLNPLPVQQPSPPLWVAAFGPKALAQAGRLGLPYLASPLETVAKLEANFQLHAIAANDEGNGAVDTRPIMRTVYVSDNASEVRQLRERMTAEAAKLGRLSEGTRAEDWAIMGDAYEVRDQIAEYQERLAIDYLVVTRMRIPGVTQAAAHASLAAVAEIAG
jgi:alkanesulfonate monooxygenase SsuD/methylene tetrahydromethanopterin reductase-like flavin-dependent oxidoreductase (luciferase family)